MKKLALWLAFSAAVLNVSAQSAPATIRPLTIGDTVPDIEFTNLINHSFKTARLSDFKGKLVILDFWATWCFPCIELFPELDSLQTQFKADLVIFAVTHQKKELIEAFIKKNRQAKNVSFIFVTDASALVKMFPHGSVPHDVWISKNRQVEAVTSSEYITYSNVKAFVNNQKFEFIAKDENLSYNYEKPIDENGIKLQSTQSLSRTIFFRHVPGLRSTYGLYKTDSSYFLSQLNQPILQLYNYIFSGKLNNFYRQTILELKNREHYVYNKLDTNETSDKWSLSNTYCYQVTGIGRPSTEAIKEKMLQDLNYYFNLNGRLENRQCTIYKITYTGSGTKSLKSKGNSPEISWNDKEAKKYFINQKISMLADYLNGAKTQRTDIFQFSDETNIPYNVDIELNINDVGDINNLKTQLLRYGLTIAIEEKDMEVFVLSDKIKISL
ncbi:MAG: redoxin domain-containing protein [Sphingobacteriales bacterium]|nr:redoxin domain-containing protein [Sphingobacteriales bacterium]OJW04024.1 MAG: hypothetical protein BGO52_17960 [Sphingobacteriales bacterium 44-61]